MTTSKIIASGIVKAILVLVGIVLLLYFLYQIQTIIVYIIVSIIFALIANPVVEFFKKKLKFPNTFAVATTMILFVFLFIGLLLLFVPLITSQSSNLSLLDTKSIETKSIALYNQLQIYLQNHNVDLSKIIDKNNITSKLNFSVFSNFFNSVLGTISGFGIGLATTFFITFFFLKDKVHFIIGVKKIIPDNHEEAILNSIDKTRNLLTRYFTGLLLQLTIVSILYFIVLLIFRIENALIIAFLCGLLNIIPYVGPLIATVLAAILTMLSNIGTDFQSNILPTTLYVIIGFFVVQIIDNNVSQPLIFSKSVNSHPLEIFLVILIIGILFGIVGMIVAVPVYTILKVIGKEFFPENKIIKVMTKNI